FSLVAVVQGRSVVGVGVIRIGMAAVENERSGDPELGAGVRGERLSDKWVHVLRIRTEGIEYALPVGRVRGLQWVTVQAGERDLFAEVDGGFRGAGCLHDVFRVRIPVDWPSVDEDALSLVIGPSR